MNVPIQITAKAASHAIRHCPATMPAAHPPPSSRRMDATAAMHGVYRRQNTSSAYADKGEIKAVIAASLSSRTESVETTLSFAIKPAIRAVTILQSPNPSGANTGAINPAIAARILA